MSPGIRHGGGDVNVVSGVGFSGSTGKARAVVQLTIEPTGAAATTITLTPASARAIGLDLIGAAHSSVADTILRAVARKHGLDGDEMIAMLRGLADKELG